MTNIEETSEQRQEQAIRQIWKKVDKRTITTGTIYRKTTETQNNSSTKQMGKSNYEKERKKDNTSSKMT